MGTIYKKHIQLVIFFTLMIIVGAGFWQLGKSSNPRNVIFTSWVHLQPQDAGVLYNSSTQTFTAPFNNAQISGIEIKKVIVSEETSATTCEKTTINGKDPTSSTVNLPVGSTFRLYTSCPNAKKKPGDPYNIKIIIEYTTRVAAATIRTEEGNIRGTVE